MAEDQVTQQDVQQFEDLDRQLTEQQRDAKRSIDVCGTWKIVKPFWPRIVELAKLIPKVGAVVSKALQLIGQGLDVYCGTGN